MPRGVIQFLAWSAALALGAALWMAALWTAMHAVAVGG